MINPQQILDGTPTASTFADFGIGGAFESKAVESQTDLKAVEWNHLRRRQQPVKGGVVVETPGLKTAREGAGERVWWSFIPCRTKGCPQVGKSTVHMAQDTFARR
ncbi:hypothetical protein KM043_011469 [Ampulex compressa]|nr:hypothetical protein KM043_011469 [Ampulex compressa]